MNNIILPKHGKFIDITGQTINKITFLEFLNKKRGHDYIWKAQCHCGKIFECRATNVKNKHTNSCGCLKHKQHTDSAFNILYSQYRSGANDRNYSFNLNKEQFKYLTQQNCYYCGIEPKQIFKRHNNIVSYIYNGIDRIDNNIGYEIDNCISCCSICNKMKHILGYNEFINQINKIYNNLNK